MLMKPNLSIQRGWGYQLMFNPMDSTRYFELGFAWDVFSSLPSELQWLDVSSPRLLLLLGLHHHPGWRGDFINPDNADLQISEMLLNATDLRKQCYLHNNIIGKNQFNPQSFDLITCISVLEHIPSAQDALESIWGLLRPKGKLVLTVPCAAKTSEQYINSNEYGVLASDQNGFVFFQRFYDELQIESTIFKTIGQPQRCCVWGEKKAGMFALNAERRRRSWQRNYPFWREPLMIGQEYKKFKRISDLPGEGVVAMEFVKS